ncbi:MAG: regulatory protein RecX, partial [Waddliaceae bacterium]
GEPWKDIHRAIFGTKPKIDLATEDLDEQFLELEYSLVKKYVFKHLGIKNYSSFELRRILQGCLVSETTISKIIEQCRHLGYIDDNDWIDVFVRHQRERNFGPKSIKMKLRAKGVPEHLITGVLESADDSRSEQQRILHLLNTRYASRDLKQYKEKQKVIAALVRKGFDLDQIYQAIKDSSPY